MDIPIRPDPPQPMSPGRRRKIMSNYRQMKQWFTQGTQTTPSTSPTAGHTTPYLMSVGTAIAVPSTSSEQTSRILTTLQPMTVPVTFADTSEQTSPILTTLQPMAVTSTSTRKSHRMPLPVVENTQRSSLTELRRTQRQRNQKLPFPFM